MAKQYRIEKIKASEITVSALMHVLVEDIPYQRLAMRVIEEALEDLKKEEPGHPFYESALYFFASDCLDCWCIFFGQGMASVIRQKVIGRDNPIKEQ